MNISLVCVGKARESYYADAAAEYQKRLSRYGAFELRQAPDLPEPVNASDADRARLVEKEGEKILALIRPQEVVVALCIDAVQTDSEGLARMLKSADDTGQRLCFVIGGSLGLGQNVLARAQKRLSMSKMTFPHQLARVMLLEQLYRACKINAGERYHK